jgi:hypothetical protein
MTLTNYIVHLALRSWSNLFELNGGTQCARINYKKIAAILCTLFQNNINSWTTQSL